RSEAADLADRLAQHLKRHGGSLAQDGGVMAVPFTFAWGEVGHVQRDDRRGTVELLADSRHQTTLADRVLDWLQEELIATVRGKIGKASGYVRTHALWLVVRNPYTHLPA